MKGRETFMSLVTVTLLYLSEGPRDHQKPPEEESILLIRKARKLPRTS